MALLFDEGSRRGKSRDVLYDYSFMDFSFLLWIKPNGRKKKIASEMRHCRR